jgi:hypothetical protein
MHFFDGVAEYRKTNPARSGQIAWLSNLSSWKCASGGTVQDGGGHVIVIGAYDKCESEIFGLFDPHDHE